MKIIHPESATTNSQSPALMNAFALPSRTIEAAKTPAKRTPSSTPTPAFNPHKDIASSSTQASRGFWGNDNMFGGGSTFCHHTLTPPPVFPRVNINPLLNDNGADRHQTPTATTSTSTINEFGAGSQQASSKDLSQPFSDWSSNTDFNLRSMDAYRMQMWSRLTREAQAEKDNVPYDLRPKFFVDPKSTISTPTPTNSSTEATMALAQLTNAASTHITSKLATSFWSAFSGPTSLDSDKLTAVVTGSAKLTVVPITPSSTSQVSSGIQYSEKTSTGHEMDDDATISLSHLMAGMKMQSGLGGGGRETRPKVRENPLGALSSFIKHASGVPARA